MINHNDLPPLKDVIQQFELNARKRLGQNFLLDLNLTRKIAGYAGQLKDTHVIEIGPGPGGLTRALLESNAQSVTVVETDPRAVQVMDNLQFHYPDRLKVISGDALKLDLSTLCPAPRVLVANLPYNIATVLLINWLRQITDFQRMTLMFQKEVADRITATPHSRTYGRLSVLSQWLCNVHLDFNVPKTAFTPPPKVMSSVVSFMPRPQPLAKANLQTLETITGLAFGQRRKMLRRSLKSLQLDFDALHISPTLRAEDLSVIDFCKIAEAADEKLIDKS